MWSDVNHSGCKWLCFLCTLCGGLGVWFLSLRKTQQMFMMPVFYFTSAVLDDEITRLGMQIRLGEMRSHPPSLWNCPLSEDGARPLPALLPGAFRRSCCYSVLGKGSSLVVLGLCSVYFLKKKNTITSLCHHHSKATTMLVAEGHLPGGLSKEAMGWTGWRNLEIASVEASWRQGCVEIVVLCLEDWSVFTTIKIQGKCCVFGFVLF